MNHNFVPDSGRYACQNCGKSYKHLKTLLSHQRYECGKEPQFQCPHCPYRAKRRAHIDKHIFRIHVELSVT
jgi:DNA-directed RNA polymerase subunit RPC12/RpoP